MGEVGAVYSQIIRSTYKKISLIKAGTIPVPYIVQHGGAGMG
jgi:hypothetical protein